MALDLSIFDGDLADAISDLPSSFVWSGVTYACSASKSTLADVLSMAGVEEEVDATLIARLSVLPGGAYPSRGAKVTWGGIVHRVVKAEPDEVSVTLYIKQETA